MGAGGESLGRKAQLIGPAVMPGISIHVVDVVRGMPATGMRVELYAQPDAGRREVGAGAIGPDGVFRHASTDGTGVQTGVHEILLHAGDFYRGASLGAAAPAFQEVIAFRFTVTDVREHYHLPFKISPWGLSVWRGR